MSFFKKLKDRLFKSSAKIEEGLDAIVEEGGVEESADLAQARLEAEQDERAADVVREAKSEAERAVKAAQLAEQEKSAGHQKSHKKERQKKADRKKARVDGITVRPASEWTQAQADAARLAEEDSPRIADAQKAGESANRAKTVERTKKAAEAEQADKDAQSRVAADPANSESADAQDADAQNAEAQADKPGILGRLLGARKASKTVVRRALDDAMLESLEDLLITTDMGVNIATRVSANLAEGRMGKRLSTEELKGLLVTEVARIMAPVAKPMPIYAKRPQVVLVVGVNGSGKTTTIGKLASHFKSAGKSVIIAAGDTFRAAAVEQLKVWGERAGAPVLSAPEGSDPASLAFEAMSEAEAQGADLLMIDTAGRLQNRQDLMEELAKIVRVIRKKDPEAPHNTLLVLDATTGQNALNQVEIFRKISDVSGLVMTKLDGTAKGGVLVALADRFGLPIHAIGVGEQIDDLAPFDPDEFARALIGFEN